jgi:ABC-type uncharacterized transport system substrate-binding protein
MKYYIKHLWLALSLPAGAILLLLGTDLDQRQGAKEDTYTSFDFAASHQDDKDSLTARLLRSDRILNLGQALGRPARLALVTLVENPALEEAIRGAIDGLQERGLVKDQDFVVDAYSAQGELGQLPQILDAVLASKPDAMLSVTTPALMAAAAKVKHIPLIFTVASDPKALGIFPSGIPDNVCGVHDDPPLGDLLDMILEKMPALSKVGIVYDAAQLNAMISVKKLRSAAKDRNIAVLEATASVVSDLPLAAMSLVQRGAQAFVLSADNLAYTGFPSILKVANAHQLPIYVTEMELVNQGATAGIGDDFYAWGKQSGEMAAYALAGVPPSQLGVKPTQTRYRLEAGKEKQVLSIGKKFKLRIVQYSETEFAERCYEGLIDGIKDAGLVEGRDYELKTYNAQGDMSTLSSIMSNIKADRVDLLMVISTPTLQAAIRQAGSDVRIVFTGVGDGVKAGAGTSETDHLPNVTGISTRSPFEGMARLISEHLPETKRVGTLFTPAEINSVLYKDGFAEALTSYGIELVAVPVTSSAEIAQSAAELCRQDIGLVAQVVDNLTRPGFALIARKATENKIPVFAFDSDQMRDGATLCLARDYYDAGWEAAEKAVKVLQGTSPGDIPFSNTKSEKLVVNSALLRQFGISLLPAWQAKATLYEP